MARQSGGVDSPKIRDSRGFALGFAKDSHRFAKNLLRFKCKWAFFKRIFTKIKQNF